MVQARMATVSPSLLSELRRRSVFKVAIVYVAAALAILQGVSVAVEPLRLPPWTMSLFWLLLLAGLPLAVILAWAYELTPRGVRRARSHRPVPQTRPLDHPHPPHSPGESRRVPRSGLPRAAAIGAGPALVAVAVWAWTTDRVGFPSPEGLDPRHVVVAVFENQTRDPTYDPLSHFATDYITEGLAGTDFAVPIDARGMPGVWRDSASDPAVVRRLARENGAGTVVGGRFYIDGDSIRFVAQITDALSGRLLRSVEPVATVRSSVEGGVEQLREQVLASLAAAVGPWFTSWETRSKERLPSFAAYRAYSAGMDAYTRTDWHTAAVQFDQAAAIDTTFLPARIWSALSHTLTAAHYLAQNPDAAHAGQAPRIAMADSIAAAIALRRDRLVPYDQHFFDWVVAFRYGDTGAGYEAAKRMVQSAPGSVNARKELAYTAARHLRPRESLQLLEQLNPERRLASELSEQYWFWLRWCPHVLGDYSAELRDARISQKFYPQNQIADVRALVGLGRVEEVERLLEQRRDSVHGGMLYTTGLEMRAHGHPVASRRTLLRALAWLEAQPAATPGTRQWREAAGLRAAVLFALGREEEARPIYTRLAGQDSVAAWGARGRLGVIAAHAGDRATARHIYDGLLADTFVVSFEAGALFVARAAVATALGDREAAVRHLSRMFPSAAWQNLHGLPDFAPLRGYPPAETLLRPKG
jgi:tetratricopeptide (TPR) repeat protein/TolB-like protein